MATRAAAKSNGTGATALHPVTNDALSDIVGKAPYTVRVKIRGSAPILFHRYSPEAVKEKGAAAKGSAAKKSDNVESYVYRCDNGHLGLPGEYLRGSLVNAARYRQDPRSPRKSAMDLVKAGVVALTELADLGVEDADYTDQRRVVIGRSAVTRERPALRSGWEATFDLAVLIPEYITEHDLLDLLGQAGRLVGVGDFRPTYGRFDVVSIERL